MDAEDLSFKSANVDLPLREGRGSNLKSFVSSLINRLSRGRDNRIGGYTFKVQGPGKKTVGYMMISVAKTEEDLYTWDMPFIRCKKCNKFMKFTCFGKDHTPAYHCPECGLFVLADSLNAHIGRDVEGWSFDRKAREKNRKTSKKARMADKVSKKREERK